MQPEAPPVVVDGWLAAHLRSGQVSRVVYGAIIGLALVLTMEAHPPRLWQVPATLLATAVAVALAELYSELLGARATTGLGRPGEPTREIVADSVAVAFGVAFPGIFFLAALVGLIGEETAYALAKWTGLGLIAGYGYLAGRLGGAARLHALLQAGVVAAIGAVLIGLKALVH